MFASPNDLEVRGVRENIHLTVYSDGMATVSEDIVLTLPSKEQEEESSTGLLRLFESRSGRTTTTTPGKEEEEAAAPSSIVIRVEELSNYIDRDSLFTSSPSSASFSVLSTELRNSDGRNSVLELLKESRGVFVRLIDSDSDRDNLTTFEGFLDNVSGSLIVLSSGGGGGGKAGGAPQRVGGSIRSVQASGTVGSSTTIMPLARRVALQYPKGPEIVWNVLKPYLRVYAIYKKVASRQGGELRIPLTYETAGVRYEISYMLLLSEDERSMSVSIKAHVNNGTMSDFDNVQITVVEVEKPREEPQRRLRYARRAQKATLYTASRGMPEASEDSGPQEASMQADVSRSQKEFRIDSLGVPTDLKSESSRDFLTHESHDTVTQLDYVYRPQKHATVVRMELVFDNTKANGMGFSLPKGEVTVMQARSYGGLSKLGDTEITKKHDKKRVRIELGVANTITARLETVSSREDKVKNATITTYKLYVKNTKTQSVRVTLKYVFTDKSWDVEEGSDIDFEVDKPDDPKTQTYTQTQARSFITAPPQAETKYTYSIAIPK